MTEGGDRSAVADALALLARRDFAERELARRLRRKGHDEAAAAAAVARCRELGYLDDESFARGRARTVIERRPGGRAALVQDLRRQGLPSTMCERVAQEALDEAGGEAAVLERALAVWVARHGEPTDWRSARRCADHLSRRGFSSAAVGDALSHWLDELGR